MNYSFSKLKGDLSIAVSDATRKWIAISISASVLLGIVEILLMVFIQFFLKAIGLAQDTMGSKYFNFEITLPLTLLLLLVIAFLRFIAQFYNLYSIAVIQETVIARLRILLFKKVLFEKTPQLSASDCHHLLGSVFLQTGVFWVYLTQLVTQSIYLAILLVALFCIDWKAAGISLIGLGLIGGLTKKISGNVRKQSEIVNTDNSRIVAGIQKVTRNWMIVRLHGTESTENEHLKRLTHSVMNTQKDASRLSNLSSAATPFLGILLIIGIIGLSFNVLKTEGAALLSFLYLFIRFVQNLSSAMISVGECSKYYSPFRASLNFAGKCTGISNQRDSTQAIRNTEPSDAPSVLLENLVVGYGEKRVSDNQFNISIAAGSQVGIYGPSGSGKSTFLTTLMGFTPSVSGTVKIRDMEPGVFLDTFSNSFRYVGPEPFLIQGSVLENLSYGIKHLPNELAIETLDSVGLWKEISEKGGLDYAIAENGSGLSMGQRQRLCLARALVARPAILVLDEATANLDASNETKIFNIISELKGRCTVFLVSHKLDNLQSCDYLLKF